MWLRALAFPFLLSLFMLPKLNFFYNQITLPLQLLASRLASAMLTATGFAVTRAGNLLTVYGHQISVEAACNGIRYLLPLWFLALTFTYLSKSPVWIRAAVAALAVPLAILANAVRVAVAAASPRLAVGGFHTLIGIAVFVLTLPVVVMLQGLFNSIERRRHA